MTDAHHYHDKGGDDNNNDNINDADDYEDEDDDGNNDDCDCDDYDNLGDGDEIDAFDEKPDVSDISVGGDDEYKGKSRPIQWHSCAALVYIGHNIICNTCACILCSNKETVHRSH